MGEDIFIQMLTFFCFDVIMKVQYERIYSYQTQIISYSNRNVNSFFACILLK